MRTLIAALLLIAIPTFAAAQERADPIDMATPTVQLEQSTPAPAGPAPAAQVDVIDRDVDTPVEAEARTAPVDDVVDIQEPGSRNWWWIVGAVVVGGLIVALLT